MKILEKVYSLPVVILCTLDFLKNTILLFLVFSLFHLKFNIYEWSNFGKVGFLVLFTISTAIAYSCYLWLLKLYVYKLLYAFKIKFYTYMINEYDDEYNGYSSIIKRFYEFKLYLFRKKFNELNVLFKDKESFRFNLITH